MDTAQTTPSPAWGGGQNQQFALAERNKKKRNRIVERDRFFASATNFPPQANHPKEDEICLAADHPREEICLSANSLNEDEIYAPEKTVPRGLGPLSAKEQEDILAQHVPKPLQTSLPLVPVVQGSYAEVLGIEPSLPHNSGPPGPRRDPHNTGPCGPRREPRPVQFRLPADHPLKVELAQVETLRRDRHAGWKRLQKSFEEKSKNPEVPLTPEQIIAQKQSKSTHKREEQIVAQKESQLLWFIRQLEKGEPVGDIGLRHEQLQQVIEYNRRPPVPRNVWKPMRHGRTQHRQPQYMTSAPSPRPIPKPQQTISKDISSTSPNIAKSPSHVQADGDSNDDEFIDIDKIAPNVVNEEIEVIDITGDSDGE